MGGLEASFELAHHSYDGRQRYRTKKTLASQSQLDGQSTPPTSMLDGTAGFLPGRYAALDMTG
jgi:hypothetical protein